jgi:hypothetical protein
MIYLSSQWLLHCARGLPLSAEGRSSLNVTQSGEHPRIQVAKQMAVECPPARVVRIECYDNACPGRHQHGITHRAMEPLAVDFHHLKLVPLQMHRVRHKRLVFVFRHRTGRWPESRRVRCHAHRGAEKPHDDLRRQLRAQGRSTVRSSEGDHVEPRAASSRAAHQRALIECLL